MYFLNGDRVYIKPGNSCESIDKQLINCFNQLQKINSGKQIYKLNFFADTKSDEDYKQLQNRVKQLAKEVFETPVICALIAQPPLTCRVLAEAFYFDSSLWQPELFLAENGSAVFFKRGSARVLVGHAQANINSGFYENASEAFKVFKDLLKRAGLTFQSVVRQWNYIENITGIDGDEQHYQVFNNVRAGFYAEHFNRNGFPAATGIGMNQGGVIIEFVAVEARNAVSLPLNN